MNRITNGRTKNIILLFLNCLAGNYVIMLHPAGLFGNFQVRFYPREEEEHIPLITELQKITEQ